MVEALQDNAMTALVDGMNAVHTAIRNNAPSGWTVDAECCPVTCCCEQCGLSTSRGLVSSCNFKVYAICMAGKTLCCNVCNWTITCSGSCSCVSLCMDSACFLGYSDVCCIYGIVYRSSGSFRSGSYLCRTNGICKNISNCCSCCVLCNVVRCYTETKYLPSNPFEYNNSCPSCTYCANQCCDIDFTKMTNAILLNAGLRSLGCGTVCKTCTSGSAGSAIPAPTITGDYTDCAMEKITLSCGYASICYEGGTSFSVCSPIYLKYCSCPLCVYSGTLTREII